jgi:hypothetical protein
MTTDLQDELLGGTPRPHRPQRGLAAVSTWLLLAIAGAAQPAMAQEPPGDSLEEAHARAEELNRRAVELLRAGRPAEAAPLARMAWHIKQSHDIAANLGIAELRVGLFRKAAEHLSHAIRLFPPNGRPDQRQLVVQGLARAKAEVCELTIHVNVERAEIKVGVVPVGRSPLPMTVFADPGPHILEATLEGYEPGRQEVTVTKGQALEVSLTLEKKPREAAAPPRPAGKALGEPAPRPLQPLEPRRGSQTPVEADVKLLVGGFGLAALAAGGGIALMVVSASHDADAEELQARFGRSGCLLPTGAAIDSCNDLRKAVGERDQTREFGVGALAFAGLLAGGTLAYLLWPRLLEPPNSARVAVLPAWSPRSGGFVVTGRW